MTYDGESVRRHIGSRWPDIQTQRKPRGYDLDLIDVPVCGFSLAIDRRLYEVFEPIKDRLWAEDQILRRRAILLSGITYIPDVLVFYRDQGLSKGAKKNQRAYLDLYLAHAETRLSVIHQSMRDVDTVSPPEAHAYFKTLQIQERSAKRRLKLIHSSFPTSVIMLFRQMVGSNREGIYRTGYLSIFMVRWVPSFFFWLRSLKVHLIHGWK